MSYATALNFIDQFGVHYVARLLDRSEENSLTAETLFKAAKEAPIDDVELSALATDAIDLIIDQLSEAQRLINSYLIRIYQMPLSDEIQAQLPLKKMTCDIARHFIANTYDLSSETIVTAYEKWLEYLQQTTKGTASGSSKPTNTTTGLNSTIAKFSSTQGVDLDGY